MITTLRSYTDSRGTLTPISFKDIPFKVKRIFFVEGTHGQKRGGHAHKECHQYAYCMMGFINFIDKSGNVTQIFRGQSLYIKPGEWYEQEYKNDAYACIFCSHEYDKNDYIK